MDGFDQSRIVIPGASQELAEKLKSQLLCQICLDLVARDPHQCKNGHQHCRKCFEGLFESRKCSVCKIALNTPASDMPFLYVRSMASKIEKDAWLNAHRNEHATRLMADVMRVRCRYEGAGCAELIELREQMITAHEQKCVFQTFQCLCEREVQKRLAQREHLPVCQAVFDVLRRKFKTYVTAIRQMQLQPVVPYHQAADEDRFLTTRCRQSQCTSVQTGDCAKYHQKCKWGAECEFAKKAKCRHFHTKNEIACRTKHCSDIVCPYSHANAKLHPFQCNVDRLAEWAAQHSPLLLRVLRHTGFVFYLCLEHPDFPLVCNEDACARAHGKCAKVMIGTFNVSTRRSELVELVRSEIPFARVTDLGNYTYGDDGYARKLDDKFAQYQDEDHFFRTQRTEFDSANALHSMQMSRTNNRQAERSGSDIEQLFTSLARANGAIINRQEETSSNEISDSDEQTEIRPSAYTRNRIFRQPLIDEEQKEDNQSNATGRPARRIIFDDNIRIFTYTPTREEQETGTLRDSLRQRRESNRRYPQRTSGQAQSNQQTTGQVRRSQARVQVPEPEEYTETSYYNDYW